MIVVTSTCVIRHRWHRSSSTHRGSCRSPRATTCSEACLSGRACCSPPPSASYLASTSLISRSETRRGGKACRRTMRHGEMAGCPCMIVEMPSGLGRFSTGAPVGERLPKRCVGDSELADRRLDGNCPPSAPNMFQDVLTHKMLRGTALRGRISIRSSELEYSGTHNLWMGCLPRPCRRSATTSRHQSRCGDNNSFDSPLFARTTLPATQHEFSPWLVLHGGVGVPGGRSATSVKP